MKILRASEVFVAKTAKSGFHSQNEPPKVESAPDGVVKHPKPGGLKDPFNYLFDKMSRPIKRATPLSDEVKRMFLQKHIPGRVRLAECGLKNARDKTSYYHFTVAAIALRSLAQFLGLKLSTKGQLETDTSYFPHEGDSSFEVKLKDVTGEDLLDPHSLPPEEQTFLRVGFDTINREVAHFTHWDRPARHHSGSPVATQYFGDLLDRLEKFGSVILRETKQRI